MEKQIKNSDVWVNRDWMYFSWPESNLENFNNGYNKGLWVAMLFPAAQNNAWRLWV